MDATKFDLKSNPLFPWHFRILAFCLLIAAVIVVFQNIFIALILLAVGLVILTSYSGMEIIPAERTYRPYNSFLFVKSGKSRRYAEVEKIYVNASKTSQRVYTARTNDSAVFKSIEYDAYIKFSNGSKEYLMTRKDKKKLFDDLKDLSQSLNIQISDNTQ